MKEKAKPFPHGKIMGAITIFGGIAMLINYFINGFSAEIISFTNFLLLVIICELIWIQEEMRK